MGAYEGSYAIRNGQLVDTSEQYILNCAKAGDCRTGWWMPVFDYLINHGTTTEAADQFTGNDALPCPTNLPLPYRASSWGFVARDQWTIPSTQAIKLALCAHGPLATAVYADEAFQAYTGGANGGEVFDEPFIQIGPHQVNHGVVILGWDDQKKAWLIRNSWGPGWGTRAGYGNEKGYMWIAYSTNNIGIATAWVDAVNTSYTLSPAWGAVLQKFRFDGTPSPTAQ
jgi:C1A family cysteine protease